MFLQNISRFISNYRYEQATIETVNTVKAAFIDFLGVAYRGVNEEAFIDAFNTIDELFPFNDSKLKASIIGKSDYRINILNAAFLNGISAHSLELDDGHRQAQAHLGVTIFPTALAVAEAYNLSGKDFFESVIVGYEVGILLGKLVNPKHRDNGFHTTGTIGSFVSGAVASKLLKLNEIQIMNALGLCGTQAAGLLESDHSGSMGKVLHVGKANYNGILSAYLSRNGFTGASTIVEGEEGFLKTMVFNDGDFIRENYSFESILKSVGSVSIKDIYFKKHPFCRHLHSSIDTALKLRGSLGGEYNHIQNIAVKTYDVAAKHNNTHPRNVEELRQSLPYAVAITLVMGEINLDTIYDLIDWGLFENYSTVDKINSIKTLAEKMIILSDDSLTELYPSKRPSNIIIKLDENFRNGVFQNATMIPKGDFENPYDLSELIDKFKNLNPNYNVNNLVIIDDIINYSMNDVVDVLNE